MRTCEAGACVRPAVYRGPRDERGAAAWCEEHVPATDLGTLGGVSSRLLSINVEPIQGAWLEEKP